MPVYEGQPYYSFDDVVENFSFWDVLDIFNPLQHIPLVNTLYREITGDQMGGFARVAGGALYGGPVGAGLGVIGMAFDEMTGGDPAQLAAGAVSSLFEEDAPAPAAGRPDAATLAGAPLGGRLLTGGASEPMAAQVAAGPDGGALIAPMARDGVHTSVFARAPAATFAAEPPPPPPTGTVDVAATGGAASDGPLGGALLAQVAGAGVTPGVVSGGAAAMPGGGADVLSLNGAQSAALAAFVAQNGGGPRAADGPGRPASAAPAVAGVDGALRAGAPQPTPSSPDTQSQDMTQTPNREFSGNTSGEDTGHRDGGAIAMPDDIRRGREAQRQRMAEAQALAEAARAAQTAQASGAAGGGGIQPQPAAAPALDGRPTGMTLADYRANPNRRAEDGGGGSSGGAAGGSRRIGAGGGAAAAGVLPDAATMAGLLERGETVAAVAARRAEQAVHGAGGLDFRAMPLEQADGDTGTGAGTGGGTPVAMQPWFSDRVMDAMRRYDAARGSGDPAS
jgi:hypothetical protein